MWNSSIWGDGRTDDDAAATDDVGATNDDPQLEEAVLFLCVLACLVCCCLSTCIVRRLRRLSGLSARYLSAELTQPLLDETDHETVLTREGGEWRCVVCGQENRRVREACDLCGLARAISTGPRAAEVEARALKAAGYDPNAVVRIVKSYSGGKDAESIDLTTRQKRAARRGRWQRAVGGWALDLGADPEDSVMAGVVVELHETPAASCSVVDATNSAFDGPGSLARSLSSAATATKLAETKDDDDDDEEESLDGAGDVEDPRRPIAQPEQPQQPQQRSWRRRRRPALRRMPASRQLSLTDGRTPSPVAPEASELERVSSLAFSEKHLWLEKQLEALRRPPSEGHARLEVRRECLLEDSVQQLLALDDKQLRQWMRVQFVDEPGIDVGGLEREWFGLAAEAVFDKAVGVFKIVTDGAYACDPAASLPATVGGHPRSDELYEFAGRLIGKAIAEHVPLRAPLALPIYKQLLGRPLDFAPDLEDLDVDLARNLTWVLQNEGVQDLDLDFSVAVEAALCAPRESLFDRSTHALNDDASGTYFWVDDATTQENEEKDSSPITRGGLVRELVPGGRFRTVDDSNKLEYARQLWRYHVVDACAPAVWRLAKGLYSVIPADLLAVFDALELELLVCGVPTIDVDDWADNTDYAGDYRRRGAKHQVIVWFWKTVRGLDQAHRARLLQYCTGSSRVPCHGFKALQRNDGKYQRFCIQSLPRNELRFPRAHTCFNRLDLPLYSTRDELEAGLKVIIAMDTTGASFSPLLCLFSSQALPWISIPSLLRSLPASPTTRSSWFATKNKISFAALPRTRPLC